MLILTLALRNLARHLRKTILIGTLIALGMGALFVAGAVFEGTNEGLETSFVRSFTGDAVLAAQSETPFSLFGNEVPIVGEYRTIPPLPSFPEKRATFDELEAAAAWTPVVSAAARVRLDGVRKSAAVFGVEPGSYFEVNSDVTIQTGDAAALSDGGVFINSHLAERIARERGRPVEPGEEVRFSMYSGGSFRIRRGYVAGIHSYPSPTESLNRVILADPAIVRGLVDYTQGFARAESAGDDAARASGAESQAPAGGDLDSLFAEAEDTVADAGEGLSAESVEERLSDTEGRDRLVQTDDAAWSFVLFRAVDGKRASLETELARVAGENGWEVRVLDWRDAAGLSAQVVFALQLGLYAGLIILTLGAILVIMNALVISVLERRTEIGTMRGLGADGRFVSGLFMVESVLLTMAASAVGIGIGVLVARLAAQTGITLENPLLQSLFGGVEVRPVVRMRNILVHLGLAAGIGVLAWIYPVIIAVRIQPASIMRQG